MNIRAYIPPGIDEITVNGLHQWDYGQVLEIECAEFGTELMEVHFACQGMVVAETSPINFTNGVGTVDIPNKCLELSTPITAWVYGLDGEHGRTLKTIRLPLIERTKPIRAHNVPAELEDRYNGLIGEVEKAVAKLESGAVVTAKALHATEADSAQNAEEAESADSAITAAGIEMQLIKQVSIINGENTIGLPLTENTPYLLVYESSNGNIGSGVIVTMPGVSVYCCCGINTTHGVWISDWDNTNSKAIITKSSALDAPTADTNANGQLYIYTFGKIV